MLVIPAIDIMSGKVVRLTKGDFTKMKQYNSDPVDQALEFQTYGFKNLHIVDLEGSKSGKISTLMVLKLIKKNTDLRIQFGGGIRDLEVAEEILETGIDKLIIGSLAVKNKALFEKIVKIATPEKILPAADTLNGFISIQGWTEKTDLHVEDHIKYCAGLGLNTFLVTDISRDGMLAGSNIDLYRSLQEKFPGLNFIASGGVQSIEEVQRLRDAGLYAAITGKALYEKRILIEELVKIAG